ncbi:MAG: 4Fe-4S binding protein [Ignavibacteriales bacterium]|nr:4Fe-4S binding protein [Ignavibacteriales bacterium]
MKNKIRVSFQFFFLSLVLYVAIRPVFDKAYLADFEKYCPFGGLASLFSKLNQDTMACNMSETQVMLGLGLLLGAGIVGKLFCSFVCPIGTISEWLGRLGDKLKIRRDISGYWDRGLRGLKYILLFVTIYFTMTSSELFCKKFDPYFAAANLFNNSDIVLYFAIPAVLVTIAGALFFRLFWCKYLCPLGAFSNIFLNVVSAGFVVLLYLTINYFGVGLNFTWLLGGLVLSGWINETGFMKSFLLPFPKITRTTTT